MEGHHFTTQLVEVSQLGTLSDLVLQYIDINLIRFLQETILNIHLISFPL